MEHSYIRPEIMVLAAEMERKMRVNDRIKRDSYKTTSPYVLFRGLMDEVRELHSALLSYDHTRAHTRAPVAMTTFAEAADVANMAMMVSYVLLNHAKCYPEKEDSELYYLQDTHSYTGNDIMWWCPAGNGYTSDLSKAAVFTRVEAEAHYNRRASDRPWLKSYIDSKSRPAVDMQYVKKEESPWP